MSPRRDDNGNGTTDAPVARLRFERGADEGRSVDVREGETITFGRDSAIEVQINDPAASRAHFKIKGFRGQPYIKDLKSRNGTYVNGARVEEARLRIGDEVRVGETVIVVEESPEADADADAREVGEEGAAERAPEPLDPEEAALLLESRPASESGTPPSDAGGAAAPAGRTDPLIGRTIAGYRIVALKGRGGMGTVYRAEQLSLHREVALKVLSSRLTKDRTFVDLFFREARAAGQLNHPNIVQVYDVGQDETGEIYFYSMEFIEDGSIQGRIDKEEKKKLPVDDAARAMLDAARGILYAEKKKIVHRDIKPDNLMLGEGGIVKIADLGLAKSLTDGPRGEEGILGTPHFISPEQASGKEVDTRSDLYSLGASFYRILTGVNPYPGKTVKEIILQRLKQPPRPIREIDPEVPEDFARIIEKLMQRDPAARYQSAEDLVRDVEEMIRVHHFGAGSKKGIYAALALAVVAVAVAVGVVVTRGGGDGKPEIIDRDNPETIARLKREQELNQIANARIKLQEIENAELREGKTEGVAAQYEAFANENPNAQTDEMKALVAKATENAAKIRRAIADEKAREEAERTALATAIEAIEKGADDALARGEIAEAHAAIAGSAERAKVEADPAHKARLEALRRKIADSAGKLREDVKAEVATYLKRFQHRKALDAIDAALKKLGAAVQDSPSSPFPDAASELRALRETVEKARVADAARLLDLDRAEFFTGVRSALKDVDALRFEAAAAALGALPDKLSSDEYRELAARWASDSAAAARVFRRAVETGAARVGKGEAIDLPIPATLQGRDRAKLRSVDSSRVEVETGGGGAASTFPWIDYPHPLFAAALESLLGEPTPEDRRDAVALLLLLQDVAAAEAACARLGGEPETAALRARVERERKALALLDQATKAIQIEGEYERPLEALGALKEDYPDTQVFLRRSDGTSHFVRRPR